MPRELLAVMITTTSYGTWLPGDLRGYVEDGRVLPPNPRLLKHAASLMANDPVLFTRSEQRTLTDAIVDAADVYEYQLFCLSVESWHLHWLIDARGDPVHAMVGRLKTAMRKALNRGRIWTTGYDKRFCFRNEEVEARYEYIMRHRGFRAIRPIAIH